MRIIDFGYDAKTGLATYTVEYMTEYGDTEITTLSEEDWDRCIDEAILPSQLNT